MRVLFEELTSNPHLISPVSVCLSFASGVSFYRRVRTHTHTQCRVLSSFVVLHDSKYNNGFLLTESNLYGWVAVSLICAFGRTSRGPYWQPSTQVLMFTWLGCQHVFLFGSVWVFFCNEISISIFFIGLFELEKCRNPPLRCSVVYPWLGNYWHRGFSCAAWKICSCPV